MWILRSNNKDEFFYDTLKCLLNLINKVLEELGYSELLKRYSAYGKKSTILLLTLFKVLAHTNLGCIKYYRLTIKIEVVVNR